jgi:hypothetical protein
VLQRKIGPAKFKQLTPMRASVNIETATHRDTTETKMWRRMNEKIFFEVKT